MHLGMPECHKPFLGHCDLDLWPSFQELLCPEHISYIIWCRNPKFGVVIPLGMAEWCIQFWVILTLTLTSGFISRFFLLYYSYLSSNVSCARPIPLGAFVTCLWHFLFSNIYFLSLHENICLCADKKYYDEKHHASHNIGFLWWNKKISYMYLCISLLSRAVNSKSSSSDGYGGLRVPPTTAASKQILWYLSWFGVKRLDISFELSAGRQFKWNIKPYLVSERCSNILKCHLQIKS